MNVIMALALSALPLQQSALAARYDDDDDDDEPTRAKVMQPAQPQYQLAVISLRLSGEPRERAPGGNALNTPC